MRLFQALYKKFNRQSALCLAWMVKSCKAKECPLLQAHAVVQPQKWKFLPKKIAPKSVPHVLLTYFSSFNWYNHWFDWLNEERYLLLLVLSLYGHLLNFHYHKQIMVKTSAFSSSYSINLTLVNSFDTNFLFFTSLPMLLCSSFGNKTLHRGTYDCIMSCIFLI